MGASEWLLLLTAVLTLVYIWIKHNFSYWRRKNVAYIEPHPVFGNLKDMILMKTCPAEHLASFYNHENAQNQSMVGIYVFNKPAIVIRDPELIKTILIKEFNKFSNRYTACDPHGDALGYYNLFFLKNPQWKDVRTKLSPVFTSGKMKQMFPCVEEVGRSLENYLANLPIESDKSCIIELKHTSELYTTDVIATVAFGIQANSLSNSNGEFLKNGRKLFHFSIYRAFEWTTIFFLPHLVSLLRCKLFNKESTKFLRNTINYAIAERIKSETTRNDLIDILVGFKKDAEADQEKKHFAQDNDMIVAQAAVFFTAGFETTSSTISFGLYELSKKPEIQKRLREEIKDALIKNDGKITYDMLKGMEYLNMVVSEILRLYPALPFLDRECTLSKDEKDFSLQPSSDFRIPNGMPVYIPVFSLHRDPKYFTDPEVFDPERFSVENKPKLVPYTYLPFGGGPHNCIGERLGMISSKIGLISFLRNHFVTPCDKSLNKMVFDPKALMIHSKDGIYLNLLRDPLLE